GLKSWNSPSGQLTRGAQAAGDAERHLERLPVVQARIAGARVVRREVGLRDPAADALGHVLAGELEMDASEDGALGGVHVHADLDLPQDVLERARLDAAVGRLRVAVHRIADPEHAPALAL